MIIDAGEYGSLEQSSRPLAGIANQPRTIRALAFGTVATGTIVLIQRLAIRSRGNNK
jgi:hypothetical protein